MHKFAYKLYFTKNFCGLVAKKSSYEQMYLLYSIFKTSKRLLNVDFSFDSTYEILVLVYVNLDLSFDSSELKFQVWFIWSNKSMDQNGGLLKWLLIRVAADWSKCILVYESLITYYHINIIKKHELLSGCMVW